MPLAVADDKVNDEEHVEAGSAGKRQILYREEVVPSNCTEMRSQNRMDIFRDALQTYTPHMAKLM